MLGFASLTQTRKQSHMKWQFIFDSCALNFIYIQNEYVKNLFNTILFITNFIKK